MSALPNRRPAPEKVVALTRWHAAATGVDARRILAGHFDISYGLRPAWWVLAAGVAAAPPMLI